MEKRRNHSPRRSAPMVAPPVCATPKKGAMMSFRRRAWPIFRSRSTTGHVEETVAVNSLLLPGIGMFVFYVCHDALQEEMFRFEGFEYGWFMSLAEVCIMLIGGCLSEGVTFDCCSGGYQMWGTTAVIGICVAGSHGFGNTALRYSTYPLKVSFKSCKLLPTMALGGCVTGRRHSIFEYIAALIMCAGLMGLTLADDTTHETVEAKGHAENTAYLGPILLGVSATLDSVVPNLQEKIFTQTNAKAVDTIFLSNSFMFLILMTITLISGELFTAWAYCRENMQVFGVLTLQAASAYCGLRCYLTIVKEHGSIAGVLLANARKVVTIMLSFFLFAKPCKAMHVLGLALIFIGVYLGVVAKRSHKQQGKCNLPSGMHSQLSKLSIEPSPTSNDSTLSTATRKIERHVEV